MPKTFRGSERKNDFSPLSTDWILYPGNTEYFIKQIWGKENYATLFTWFLTLMVKNKDFGVMQN